MPVVGSAEARPVPPQPTTSPTQNPTSPPSLQLADVLAWLQQLLHNHGHSICVLLVKFLSTTDPAARMAVALEGLALLTSMFQASKMGDRTRSRTSFRLAFWNAEGISGRENELHHFAREHALDLILVSETHLKPDHRSRLQGYHCLRTDRPGRRRGGGTAIYVRRSVVHRPIQLPPLQSLEATAAYVHLGGTEVLLVSVYHPPRRQFVVNEYLSILNLHPHVILAGDFNAKHQRWHCGPRADARGRDIVRMVDADPKLRVEGPWQPTHHPRGIGRPSVIDFAIIKHFPYHLSLTSVNALHSDHNPVLAEINTRVASHDIPFSNRDVDWDCVKVCLNDSIPPNPNITDIPSLEAAVSSFTSTVTRTVHNLTVHSPAPLHPDVLPVELVLLIRRSWAARRLHQRHRTPHHLALLRRLRHEVRLRLREHKMRVWEDTMARVNLEDGDVWRIAKALRNRGGLPTSPIQGTQGLAYEPQAKANVFADYLQRTMRPRDDPQDLDFSDRVRREVRRYFRRPPDEADRLPVVKPSELQGALRRLKPKKAAGPDGLTPVMLQRLPFKAVLFLTKVFNMCLALCHFPRTWREAKVICILKPGKDPLHPANYRSISLLSVLSKVFERILLARLSPLLGDIQAIPLHQFGFRPGHSTPQQLLRVVEAAALGYQDRAYTAAVSLDVEKAFSTTWHAGLLHKLIQLELPSHIIHILHAFLRHRSFVVQVAGDKSTRRPAIGGVPEGSVLSPTLFSVYMADIPTEQRVNIAQYADDVLLYSTDRNPRRTFHPIQRHLRLLQEWCRRWRLSINPEKSHAILFTKRHFPANLPNFTYRRRRIEWGNSITYLGVQLDKGLTFGEHFRTLCHRANGATASLYPMLRSGMSAPLKVRLFRALVIPILLYACEIWGMAAGSNLLQLQRVQNRGLRTIYSVCRRFPTP